MAETEETTPQKMYVSYQEVHDHVVSSADTIQQDFNPDVIIAIGTGGFIPGKILKEALKLPMYTVTVSLYDENNKDRDRPEKVQWLSRTILNSLNHKRVLVVDEMDDTRKTLAFCVRNLLADSLPQHIGVYTVHNKQKEKKDWINPEIYYHASEEIPDVWVTYPWEL